MGVTIHDARTLHAIRDNNEQNVIIVGAGPGGLSVAMLLAKQGAPRHRARARGSCGGPHLGH